MLNFPKTRRRARSTNIGCGGAITLAFLVSAAYAQTAPLKANSNQPYGKLTPLTPDPYHERETKYLFGFTEGSDIGVEGEQAFEYETTTEAGKRGGRFSILEHEFEYENVPTQNFAYELAAHGLAFHAHDVEGADDANGFNFSGLSAKFRYLAIGRGPGSPFGLTFIAEPEWARIDDGGTHVTDFSNTFKAVADTELIPNRLYGAINLSYTPDIAKSSGAAWETASELGATAALAYRISPKVTLGGEVEYYSAFEGLAFKQFAGHALYLGPTLHVQVTPKIMIAAAFSGQVAGHAAGDPRPLDLDNFTKYKGNLKIEFEF